MFDNSTILITGGTGSFGKTFCKHLLENYDPHRVRVLSRDEDKQRLMELEFDDERLFCMLGDVRSLDRMMDACRNVDYVVHAAALKQVPAIQRDPEEGLHTNVIGTVNVAKACRERGVEKALFLSTDKSVAPHNPYGKTKALAEDLWLRSNAYRGRSVHTRFSCTRYGNVMGSRGSVIPVFRERFAKRLPLHVTGRTATRFWMHMDEAVQLVLETLAAMQGGEVIVPKLPSFCVWDLAVAIAGADYAIVPCLPRDGDKEHELLISQHEKAVDLGDRFALNVEGDPLPYGFWYGSDNNVDWLDVDAIKARLYE